MAVLSRLQVFASQITRRGLGNLERRSQLLYDDDYYYDGQDEEEERRKTSRNRMLDSDGWVPGRGVQTLALLSTSRKLIPDERKLVPDEVICALLSKRLEEGCYRGENGFILDGIPRTRTQAEIVDQIADIDLVVNLKRTNEHLVKKNLGTGNFSACREYLSMGNSVRNLNLQSKEELLKSSPADAEQTKSLEDYYRKQHKLIDFQVKSAPGETWQGLLAALHLQHINAVNSSQKLTA